MEVFQKSILFLMVVGCACAANMCCPSGYAVLWKRDLCWEPASNKTVPLILTCKETAKFLHNYTVNENEQLEIALPRDNFAMAEPNEFCMANATYRVDKYLKNALPVAVVCINAESRSYVDEKVLGYCMVVSVIFFSLTAIIYGALPELRDIEGKSIINFCVSLATAFGIMTMIKIMTYSDMALCATRGFLAYFFFIAAFFWTNAISIQVLLNTRRPMVSDYSWRTFKWYFLYAWGCPTVLTVCMAIVNFHPGKHQKPGIGLNHCWFLNVYQQWYYMYSVMTLLLTANICIFIYTSTVLWRQSFSSSHIKALKYKFTMTVRLIILMGIPWVFEMCTTLTKEHIIWSILDVFNTLQGFLIFILLVVFRRKVIKQMYKHHWLDCISGPVEKHLAVEDDEENVVQHTDVPMYDGNLK